MAKFEYNYNKIHEVNNIDESLSFDDFIEIYGLEKNEIFPDDEDENLYHYSEDQKEDDYIETRDEHYVWTIIEGDDENYIMAGRHIVNRLGYYVSEKRWENENIIVNF